jgi:hypothetical protein
MCFVLFCFQAVASLERQQCCQICIETFSELLLPVAFSPSADVYRYVLSTWIKNRFPVEQNMAIAFVHTAMKNFPSMAATRHKRHQPTFNKDRSKSWFDGALRHLKLTHILQEQRRSALPMHHWLRVLLRILMGLATCWHRP